ncbi:unnamed protein product, partial [Choristocarpus tenellus]
GGGGGGVSGKSEGAATLVRHLCIDFICAFMDSGDNSIQAQMLAGARGGGVLGLPLRGALWRDPPNTALLFVETLRLRLLLNRRVSRRSKADFFNQGNIEHLRKVYDGSPPQLYQSVHNLMRSLLCDPSTSPFLMVTTPASNAMFVRGGRDCRVRGRGAVVVTSPRVLLRGLACLGGHDDLSRRQLVVDLLQRCPSLFPGYLRVSFVSASLEPKATYRCLQTYTLLSNLLREVPLDLSLVENASTSTNSNGKTLGSQVVLSPETLLGGVMPPGLGKKELTKGVLSGNALLQASTMTLIADILDRGARVAHLITLQKRGKNVVASVLVPLRQRLPEVQTLLGLRDKLGGGKGGGDNSGADPRAMKGQEEGAGGDGEEGKGGEGEEEEEGPSQGTFLRWRLLSLLSRYADCIPGAIAASGFDFLKLLPNPGGGGDSGNQGGGMQALPPLLQLETMRLLSKPGSGTEVKGSRYEGEGEPGVWVDLATPAAVGAFVRLVGEAVDGQNVFLMEGVKWAEEGMIELLGSGAGDICGGNVAADDWEVEFSPLAVAAVMALAQEKLPRFSYTLKVPPKDSPEEATLTVGDDDTAPATARSTPAPAALAPALPSEAIRLFAGAGARLLHLHHHPVPFAGLCLALA